MASSRTLSFNDIFSHTPAPPSAFNNLERYDIYFGSRPRLGVTYRSLRQISSAAAVTGDEVNTNGSWIQLISNLERSIFARQKTIDSHSILSLTREDSRLLQISSLPSLTAELQSTIDNGYMSFKEKTY
ncbi:hypothetical protein CDAR_533341 [Caerostris darwini]|uniref:Uncharacterized protein n=1 Tax=Caerostris darwini TaxID=1538125 RepID=A0AAV4RQM2_9ARAC|nr:hypothetical protein CDAR_533341 [Caerostris darwini]